MGSEAIQGVHGWESGQGLFTRQVRLQMGLAFQGAQLLPFG